MDVILIALALIASPPEPTARDLAFIEVQVSWLAGTDSIWDLDQVLPRRQAMMIRQLNCDEGDCRDLAQFYLSELGYDAFEALCWGTHVKKAMVSHHCRRLINEFYVCDECGGTGVCSTCWGMKGVQCPTNCSWRRECLKCNGALDLRYGNDWMGIHRIDVFTGKKL